MQVRRDKPNPDIPIGRPLNPPRREQAVRVAVDQQRQHQPRMILRLAAGAFRNHERVHRNPLSRRYHEVRDIVVRRLFLQVGRQEIGLITVKGDVVRHPRILHHQP
jgi:hypothetical protein